MIGNPVVPFFALAGRACLFGAACYFEVVLGKNEAKHLIDQVASTVGTIPLPYVPSWSRQDLY